MTDVCQSPIIHLEAVRRAQDHLPSTEEVRHMGDFFKVMGDPTRLRILTALLEGELCVCDLSAALGMTVSSVSHQLAVLRRSRLITNRRDGKVVYYRLDDDHVDSLLQLARTHLSEEGIL